MEIEDTYKTIQKPSKESLFKDKGSKFYGYAFPVLTEDDVKTKIEELKKQHHSARHWCYAYKIGVEDYIYRVNDDGEPKNSAGQPIYGKILSNDLTNILIVVVRYFGGVKLGVGGLMNAYKTSASLAIENSKIITKTITENLALEFEYKDTNRVMRIIKEERLDIINQIMEESCKISLSVRKKDFVKAKTRFQDLRCVKINKTT